MVTGDSQVFHQILGSRSLWHFDPFLIPDILRLAVNLGAVALHIFLLVPTGRGKELKDQEI
jgi:uncharacterized membrane protein